MTTTPCCVECSEPATETIDLVRREPDGSFAPVQLQTCGDADCRHLAYATVGLRREAAEEARRLHGRAQRHAAAQHSEVH